MDDESFMWIDGVGSEIWKNKKGERHRLGGPAYISKDGREDWYKDGKWHRLDGPAVILSSGHKQWYIRGNRHREDGPAVINSDGSNQWWLNKVFYETKEDWFDALSDEAKMKCIFSEGFLNG